MKLFLASTFADSVKLFQQRVHKGKVLFIANPGDPFKGGNNSYWIKKDYNAFVSNGFEVTKLDLKIIDAREFGLLLKRFDIIHVCGGSAIYILDLLRKKEMDAVLIRAIKKGLVYTGTSAGSMIMAPNISFCADDEDEIECGMAGKVKNLEGLNLVPCYLMCHVQDPYYIPSTKNCMDRPPKYKHSILFLRDGFAVWVDELQRLEIVH